MPPELERPTGPIPEHFAGASVSATLKRLFHATRPKFYPASVMPVIVGTAWGAWATGALDVTVFVLALFATVCVHAASNVLNDVGDESGGTDQQNQDRIYPYTGGSQFIVREIIDSRGMARLGAGLMILAAIAGVGLLLLKGPIVLVFGAIGLLLAIIYSVGPLRLSSLGLGEASIAIAFGVLPVAGAAWLQSGVIDTDVIIFSLPVSMYVTAILLINEVPDRRADAATGKRTLPVRLGLDGTSFVYFGLHLVASAAWVWLAAYAWGRSEYPAATILSVFAAILLLALASRAAQAIRRNADDREAMTRLPFQTIFQCLDYFCRSLTNSIDSLWQESCPHGQFVQ